MRTVGIEVNFALLLVFVENVLVELVRGDSIYAMVRGRWGTSFLIVIIYR
jgi:hypothetical protein